MDMEFRSDCFIARLPCLSTSENKCRHRQGRIYDSSARSLKYLRKRPSRHRQRQSVATQPRAPELFDVLTPHLVANLSASTYNLRNFSALSISWVESAPNTPIARKSASIPKRKKTALNIRLSCKIEYLFRSNHTDQSMTSEYFTGD
jgi:hypothetical protein